MGFKPRALISNNHRSSNNGNPSDSTTGRPQPIMAVGPSVFSSIPQFQQDPGRRGLNWGDAVANARWTSGLQYTSSRQTAGPSKLDLAVWAHERKSASTLAFKPPSTDFQSHDVAGSGSRDSLRPEGSLPPLAPPRTYRNPLLPADNNGMEAMCRTAIHTGSSSSSSSPLTTLGGLASPTPPSPPSHAEPIPSSVGGASPLPPQQQHQYTASSSILLPLLRTPQTRPQPPPQQHSQQPSRSKAGAKRGASKAGGSSIGSVRSTPLGRHPIVVKSLEDTPSSAPVLWNVTGLRGWCIERLIHTTPQMSQGVLSRFLPPESSRVDSDTLRLHVASTSVAIQDIITKASCSSTSPLSMGVPSSTGVKTTPTDTSKPSGLQLLDASALFVPGMPFNQQHPSNSNSLSRGALPAIPQQVPPIANGGRGMSLGSLLFPSPSSSQQVQGVPSLGSVQPANWERASNATTLSELALENMGRREGMRKGVLERSAGGGGGGGGGGGIKTSIFSDTPFTSTRPLHSALVTRALRELEAMSEAGLTMLDGGASAGRARALAACHSFLVPSAETLSVSVLGVLWVLENEFDVRCKSLQRSLAEVLTSQFMSSLCGGEDGDTAHTKPRRRTTSIDGKVKPTKLQDLKFNELVRRDKAFYSRDVVAADTTVPPPPPPAQDADDTTNLSSTSSPKRAKVRAPLVPLTQDKYLRESEACLFGVLPAARVDVRWVVSLFDKYLNDHLSPKTPTRLSVPTPKIHNSYKCLASIFAQFDISRRRCVKTSSLRDVKTQSVSVRVRDSGTSSNGTHKQDIIAHAISRVEAMYKVMSGMPRPDRGVYLSAYGHAPLAEGEGGPSSLVPMTGRDAPDINQPSASPTTGAASTTASSIPRTRLPSRRALTALLYLFQQVYPVCTTTCSEEQFIASYVAGSYFEASTCTTSTNVDVDGEDQKADKGGDDGGDAEQDSDVVASSSPKSKKGSVFILPNSANTTNKSSSPIDVTFVKTVEYYAADIAAHWLEGGGQNSVRAVASRLNSQHGGSSSSVSSKPPIINKDMLVSIMGDPGAVKRAPKGALGDDGVSNMKPKHTLPPPPLPSTIMPQSPEASSLRQLPAVLLSAFTSDIIKHIMQEEYGYDGDELLPQVVELDWIVS